MTLDEETREIIQAVDEHIVSDDAEINDDEQTAEERKSTATKLKDLVFQQSIEFGYNDEFRAFVRIEINNHREVYPIDSMQFHDYLFQLYDQETGNVLPKSTYESVNDYLGSYARTKGKRKNIVIRVGIDEGNYYLDLCNPQWQVIEISKNGWQVTANSPVWFYRTNDMGALPMPDHHGNKLDLERLSKYLNFRERGSIDLIIGWLLGGFLVNSSRPILVLQGVAGAGKSTASQLIRSILDPAKQKQSISRPALTADSLAIDAIHQHTLVYDNFSAGTITAVISDMLCTMATNQSYSKRSLYTNSDEVIVKLGRAIIINGIDDLAKRQDLLDRSIILEVVKPKERHTEAEIYGWFNVNHSRILGAILNVVVDSLKHTGESTFKSGRMVDWCRFVENGRRVLGQAIHYFGDIYDKNRHNSVVVSIETNPFIGGILELMDDKRDLRIQKAKLVNEIRNLDSYDPYSDKRGAIPAANQVKQRLKRDAPILEQAGITYQETTTKGKNFVHFYRNKS